MVLSFFCSALSCELSQLAGVIVLVAASGALPLITFEDGSHDVFQMGTYLAFITVREVGNYINRARRTATHADSSFGVRLILRFLSISFFASFSEYTRRSTRRWRRTIEQAFLVVFYAVLVDLSILLVRHVAWAHWQKWIGAACIIYSTESILYNLTTFVSLLLSGSTCFFPVFAEFVAAEDSVPHWETPIISKSLKEFWGKDSYPSARLHAVRFS